MKKVYCSLFTLSVSAVLLTSSPLYGASASPSAMDEVVVSASRIEQTKKDVSANIQVISREEIEQSPSSNVGDLLAETNVGHIQKYPGNLTSVGIRGFRTDTHGNDLQGHVLILLDGRRAGSGNVAKFLTKNVERIEVIRGPGAVQYGSAGMGGVVNIITRQGADNSLFVEGGGGSFDTFEGSLGGEAKEGGFDFAGAVTSRTYDDYETGDGDTFHNTGVDYETGISANLGYSLSDNQRVGLIFTGFDVSESGSPEYFSSVDEDDYSDKSNYSVDLNYKGSTTGGKYQWMGRYFIGEDENTWVDPTASNPSGYDNGVDSSNQTDQMGAQVQVTGTFGTSTLTAGFDWLSYDVENSWTPKETEYDNPAFFLLGQTSLYNRKLTVNYGLRYDMYDVSVSEPAGRDEDQDHLTPMVGVAWQLSDGLKVRAQYAEGFMMPSADQLAADYSSFGSRVVGNSDLDPETSRTYEGGVDYDHIGLAASLTYFHTDFEDKIVSDYLMNGSRSWKNLGDATIAGFEAMVSYDIGAPLEWAWEVKPYLSLTLLTDFEDEETGEDLQYVSDTNISGGIVVNNGSGISCRFNVSHTGSQDVQDWESGAYPAPVVELDAITVADLTASWRFYEDEGLGAFTLRGEVTNMFDEDYAYVKGYPMPGRGYFVSLRWDY